MTTFTLTAIETPTGKGVIVGSNIPYCIDQTYPTLEDAQEALEQHIRNRGE